MVARRGAEDDGPDLRRRAAGWSARTSRRWPGSPTPSTSSRAAARRDVARHPARDDVRADRHRQPAGERLPGDQPVRAARPRLLQRRRRADRPRRARRAARWTRRSSSAPRTSTAPAGCASASAPPWSAHSDPASEVAETRAKAAGLLAALRQAGPRPASARTPTCGPRWSGATRPSPASGWTATPTGTAPVAELAGRRVLVVDAEDTFTSMLDHQLRSLGLSVTVRRFDEPYDVRRVRPRRAGPGPRRPARHRPPQDRRTCGRRVRRPAGRAAGRSSRSASATRCSASGSASTCGRRDVPNQGVQQEIDLFGRRERVGFYNTFAARLRRRTRSTSPGSARWRSAGTRDPARCTRCAGRRFASVQFHAESVLTQDGPRILGSMVRTVRRR